jgi:hypothetical protein
MTEEMPISGLPGMSVRFQVSRGIPAWIPSFLPNLSAPASADEHCGIQNGERAEITSLLAWTLTVWAVNPIMADPRQRLDAGEALRQELPRRGYIKSAYSLSIFFMTP